MVKCYQWRTADAKLSTNYHLTNEYFCESSNFIISPNFTVFYHFCSPLPFLLVFSSFPSVFLSFHRFPVFQVIPNSPEFSRRYGRRYGRACVEVRERAGACMCIYVYLQPLGQSLKALEFLQPFSEKLLTAFMGIFSAKHQTLSELHSTV